MSLDFRRDGLLVSHLAVDAPERHALVRAMREYVASERVQQKREAFRAWIDRPVTHEKPFVVQDNGNVAALMWGAHLQPMISELVGEPMALVSAGLWCVLPSPANFPWTYSQKWHRDPRDAHRQIAKVFWYLTDVDEENGPFEYITGSAEGPQPTKRKLAERYAPPDLAVELDTHPAKAHIVGPAGTFVICDTSGWHRGGRCRSRERHSVVLVYVSGPQHMPR